MNCTMSTACAQAPRSEWLARLSGWWRGRAEAWRTQRRQHAMERTLPELDERTLRDLGLARGELVSYWAESDGLAASTRLRLLAQLDRRLGL